MQKLCKCKINNCWIFKNFLKYNKKLLLILQIKAGTSYLTPILEDLYFEIKTHTKNVSCTVPVQVSALFVLVQFM